MNTRLWYTPILLVLVVLNIVGFGILTLAPEQGKQMALVTILAIETGVFFLAFWPMMFGWNPFGAVLVVPPPVGAPAGTPPNRRRLYLATFVVWMVLMFLVAVVAITWGVLGASLLVVGLVGAAFVILFIGFVAALIANLVL